MKTLFLSALLAFTCLSAKSQKLSEYKALNGITYHPRDTVKLGTGSGMNGMFVYLVPGGMESLNYNTPASESNLIKRKFTRTAVIIKKIKSRTVNGVTVVTFVVTSGFMYPLNLDIDGAIENHEVLPVKI